MARWARIENGVVAETVGSNPAGKYHSSLYWEECDESVMTGDIYNGTFQRPPERLLSVIKTGIQTANKASCRKHILSKYTEETQRNAALGVYGEEFKETCADFISRCISVEDDAFDAVAACMTTEALAALPALVFPED